MSMPFLPALHLPLLPSNLTRGTPKPLRLRVDAAKRRSASNSELLIFRLLYSFEFAGCTSTARSGATGLSTGHEEQEWSLAGYAASPDKPDPAVWSELATFVYLRLRA